jgi:phosphatidylserine/phosphatidylglycerophosphate/cardiolipin synthase-like enzyme
MIHEFVRRVLPLCFAAAAALSTLAALVAASPEVVFTQNLPPPPDAQAVTLLERSLIDRINAATTSIDAALYEFERAHLRDALLAAKARGVQVRVVTDDETRRDGAYAQTYAALEQAGIPVLDDAGAPHSRVHDKYLIIDRSVVWTASANLTTADLTANHNHGVVLASCAAAGLFQQDFEQMAAGTFGSAKAPSAITEITCNGHKLSVYFSPQDKPLDRIIAEVNAAQHTIDFAILQLRDDRLAEALAAAVERGVQVRGLMDADSAGDGGSDQGTLCAAGVALKIENTPGRMHHKLMIIDAQSSRPRVVSGSLNWTAEAGAHYSENTVIMTDPSAARTFAAAFSPLWLSTPALYTCNVPPLGGAPPRLYLPAIASDTEA